MPPNPELTKEIFDMSTSIRIDVPDALAASHSKSGGASGRAWITALPGLAADFLDRWALRLDGPAGHGMASLVLPVIRADGTPGALKLQPVSEDNAAAPIGLRAWNGDGVVRLLDHDPDTGTMLLERLGATRPLSSVADDSAAVQILAELLARLVAVPAPKGLRQLADIATGMLDQVPRAVPALRDPAEQRLVRTCASTMAELIGEPGDRLLHWDLHYDNILAGQREPWLAIDPEPLAGDPGFDLMPALDNRWEEVVATGDVARAVLRRFDLLTEVLGLDRQRATGWTLGRVLQNALWDIEDGETALAPTQGAIATTLLHRQALTERPSHRR
jgi:streptomycin 6-kinase